MKCLLALNPFLNEEKNIYIFFNFEPLFIKVTKQEKESKFRKDWESVKVA